MAVQSMSSSIVTLRNQYICSAIKTDLASQRHDICFLYSKEGTRFQIRKIVLMQTQRLRDIFSSSLCCNGRCGGNSDPSEFFFPEIHAIQLRSLIEFLYTGVLRGLCNEIHALVSMLTTIFGFPNSMSLQRITEDKSRFMRCEKDDIYTCVICNNPVKPVHEIYNHVQSHIDEQYNNNLKCAVENQDCSPCCICNHVLLIRGDETAAKDLIKDHNDTHAQELNDFMVQKFGWNWNNSPNNTHVSENNILPSTEIITQNHENISSSSSNLSPLFLRSSSKSSCAGEHTSSRPALKQINDNPSKIRNSLSEDSSLFNKEMPNKTSSNIPTSKLDKACTSTGLSTPQLTETQKIPDVTSELEKQIEQDNIPLIDLIHQGVNHDQKTERKKRQGLFSQTDSSSTDEHISENVMCSSKIRSRSRGKRKRLRKEHDLLSDILNDIATPPIEDTRNTSQTFSRSKDVSPTSSIENFGIFTCIICRKKVKSKSKAKHAVKHYLNVFPDDSIQRSIDNYEDFICSREGCTFKCSTVLDMKQHYAITHGELEKHLKKSEKTLSDLYLTKKPKASNKLRLLRQLYATPQNHALKNVSLNQVGPDVASDQSLVRQCLNSDENVFGANVNQKELVNKASKTNITGDENIVQDTQLVEARDLQLTLCCSPISSDSLCDEEEHSNQRIQTSQESMPEHESNKNLYPEIDTDAETDKEDTI